MCLHQNLEGESQGPRSSQDHIIKGSVAGGSKQLIQMQKLESAFFGQHQQMTTEATLDARTKMCWTLQKGKD